MNNNQKERFLLLLTLFIIVVLGAKAENDSGTCGDNLTWTFVESTGTLTISGSGAMTNYIIPGDAPWDSEKENIKTVIIKDGVTSIGNYAFQGCINLTSVNIPSGVTSIGKYAFFVCEKLPAITIPSSVQSIGKNAFGYCKAIETINIPASVTSIGENAFLACSSLASITVENGNTTYDSRNECNAIIETSINTLILGCKKTVIPSGVEAISEKAFNLCKGLTTINIPASVTSIGSFAFSQCPSLASITVDGGNQTYDSRNNCNAIIQKSDSSLIVGCKATVIPSDVKTIGDNAFYGMTGLKSITIPASVITIGSDAFTDCDSLEKVTIAENSKLETIGSLAFDSSDMLADINIPSSVKTIGSYAFASTDFKTIIIPASVDSIGNSAFSLCEKLLTVIMQGTNPPTIGNSVFYNNPSEQKIYVPNIAVDTYQSNWSAYDSKIVGYDGTCGDGLVWILTDEDNDNTKETLTILGSGAMADFGAMGSPWYSERTSITNVVMDDAITHIGDNAFADCEKLVSLNMPTSLQTIGVSAFYACSSLAIDLISQQV